MLNAHAWRRIWLVSLLVAVFLIPAGAGVPARAADPAVAANPAAAADPPPSASVDPSADPPPSPSLSAEPSSTPTPPPTPSAPPAPTKPLAGIVIAVDPGHNGGNASHPEITRRRVWIGTVWKPCNKVGTMTRNGLPEHRFNWLVAKRVTARLEALGATVRMTRTNDTGAGPCVSTRGRFGAKVAAVLEVSIHADGSQPRNRGFYVMRPGTVKGWTDDIAGRSKSLAIAIRRGLRGAGLPIANYYARNGVIARTDLGTLNFSDVPVVEVELGNMKNFADAARMASAIGRDRYAKGLVAGIRDFLGR